MTEHDDDPEIIVCAGPPICLLQGDDAVANQLAGCTTCKRIIVRQDGSEREYQLKSH